MLNKKKILSGRIYVITSILALMLAGGWVLFKKQELILEVERGGVNYTIYKRRALVDNILEVRVNFNKSTSINFIDDKSDYAIIGLVEVGDLVLVTNNQYVIGVIDRSSHKVLGRSKWREFPFTIRTDEGTVFAEAVISPTMNIRKPFQVKMMLSSRPTENH